MFKEPKVISFRDTILILIPIKLINEPHITSFHSNWFIIPPYTLTGNLSLSKQTQPKLSYIGWNLRCAFS